MNVLKRDYSTHELLVMKFFDEASDKELQEIRNLFFDKYVQLLGVLNKIKDDYELVRISQKKLALVYEKETGKRSSQMQMSKLLVALENEGNLVERIGRGQYAVRSNSIEDFGRLKKFNRYTEMLLEDSSSYGLSDQEQHKKSGVPIKDIERIRGYLTYVDVLRYMEAVTGMKSEKSVGAE